MVGTTHSLCAKGAIALSIVNVVVVCALSVSIYIVSLCENQTNHQISAARVCRGYFLVRLCSVSTRKITDQVKCGTCTPFTVDE